MIFVSVTLLLCRGFSRFERMAAPDVVRATALVLVLFMGILPAALAGMPNDSQRLWATLPSPFIGTAGLTGALTHDRTAAAGVLFVAALVLTMLADRLLVARARR